VSRTQKKKDNRRHSKKLQLFGVAAFSVMAIVAIIILAIKFIPSRQIQNEYILDEHVYSLMNFSIEEYGEMTIADVYGRYMESVRYRLIDVNPWGQVAKVGIRGRINGISIEVSYLKFIGDMSSFDILGDGDNTLVDEIRQAYRREWNIGGFIFHSYEDMNRVTVEPSTFEAYLFRAYTEGYDDIASFQRDNNIDIFNDALITRRNNNSSGGNTFSHGGAEAGITDSSATPSHSAGNNIGNAQNVMPISVLGDFLGSSKQRWIDNIGDPDYEQAPFLVYEGLFECYFDMWEFPYTVLSVYAEPAAVSVNGVGLNRPSDELDALLGEPSNVEFIDSHGNWWDGYHFTYDMGYYRFSVVYADARGGEPYKIIILLN
jgi:hypothetical protein